MAAKATYQRGAHIETAGINNNEKHPNNLLSWRSCLVLSTIKRRSCSSLFSIVIVLFVVRMAGIEPASNRQRTLLGKRASLHDECLVVSGASATLGSPLLKSSVSSFGVPAPFFRWFSSSPSCAFDYGIRPKVM